MQYPSIPSHDLPLKDGPHRTHIVDEPLRHQAREDNLPDLRHRRCDKRADASCCLDLHPSPFGRLVRWNQHRRVSNSILHLTLDSGIVASVAPTHSSRAPGTSCPASPPGS